MNKEKNQGGFFDKIKKLIGINQNTTTKKEINKNNIKKNKKINPSKEKKDDELKNEKIDTIKKKDDIAIKDEKIKDSDKNKENKDLLNKNNNTNDEENDEDDFLDGISAGTKSSNQNDNKKEESFSDEETSSTGSLAEKFQKKGIGPKKDLKQIADEALKKKEELDGKAFIESDAAKKDIKKQSTGYNKVVKKKTLKALEGKIYLVRGKDGNRPAWHYILVPKDKEIELKKQKAGTNIDVADYGKIVKSGWGEDPSDEIKREIEEEYGS